jgi:hypothetical protein
MRAYLSFVDLLLGRARPKTIALTIILTFSAMAALMSPLPVNAQSSVPGVICTENGNVRCCAVNPSIFPGANIPSNCRPIRPTPAQKTKRVSR